MRKKIAKVPREFVEAVRSVLTRRLPGESLNHSSGFLTGRFLTGTFRSSATKGSSLMTFPSFPTKVSDMLEIRIDGTLADARVVGVRTVSRTNRKPRMTAALLLDAVSPRLKTVSECPISIDCRIISFPTKRDPPITNTFMASGPPRFPLCGGYACQLLHLLC